MNVINGLLRYVTKIHPAALHVQEMQSADGVRQALTLETGRSPTPMRETAMEYGISTVWMAFVSFATYPCQFPDRVDLGSSSDVVIHALTLDWLVPSA